MDFNLLNGEIHMKLRIGGLMLVLLSFVLSLVAQDSSNAIDPAHRKIVWNITTVTLNGPNGQGQGGDAPTVLSVTGGSGTGNASGQGSGIQITAGAGTSPSGQGTAGLEAESN